MLFSVIGSFSNENGEKAIGLLNKQNDNFTRASRFSVHVVAVTARQRREHA